MCLETRLLLCLARLWAHTGWQCFTCCGSICIQTPNHSTIFGPKLPRALSVWSCLLVGMNIARKILQPLPTVPTECWHSRQHRMIECFKIQESFHDARCHCQKSISELSVPIIAGCLRFIRKVAHDFSNVTRIGVPNYYDYRSSHRRVSRLMNIYLAQGPLKFEFSTFSLASRNWWRSWSESGRTISNASIIGRSVVVLIVSNAWFSLSADQVIRLENTTVNYPAM